MRFLTGCNSVMILGLAISGFYLAAHETRAEASAISVREISIKDVEDLIDQDNAEIFDANSEDRYLEGHLPKATHLPFSEVTKDRLPKNFEKTIVFYCWNRLCSSSHDAATRAAALGHVNVFVMRDGITGWEKAGKALERGRPQR